MVERYQSFPLRTLEQPLEGGEHPIPGAEPSLAGVQQKGSCRLWGRGEWLEGLRVPSHSMGKVGSPVSHSWLRCAD